MELKKRLNIAVSPSSVGGSIIACWLVIGSDVDAPERFRPREVLSNVYHNCGWVEETRLGLVKIRVPTISSGLWTMVF